MKIKLNKFTLFIKKIFLAKKILLSVSFLGIFYNLFFLNSFSDLYFLFFSLLYFGAVHQFKQGKKFSIAMALFFLFLCPFLISLKSTLFIHKISAWAFTFLSVGILEHMLSLRKQNDQSN